MTIVPLPIQRAPELFALYDTYDRPPDPHLSPPEVQQIVANIRGQGGEIFVTELGGKLVGSYSIYICHNLVRGGRPFAVIEHLVCLPAYRRKGIGRALMQHAIAHAESGNCYKVFLNTGESKNENHAFYEACGFKGDKRGFQVRFGA